MKLLTPNAIVDKRTMQFTVVAQMVLAILLWSVSPSKLIPKPTDVYSAFIDLWEQGLGAELITSLFLNLQAIALATILALALSYSTVMPFFGPIVAFIGKLRFLSMVGLTFVFTLVATSGHELKLSLLIFSITVFFVTSMVDVIRAVPKEQYDLARVMHMGKWRVVWEVVVLGQFDKVFDVVRQNAAMSWMMISLVESIVRSGGGIGALLVDQNRHFRLEGVFAIQFSILILGIGQDMLLYGFKRMVCPYAFLTVEAR